MKDLWRTIKYASHFKFDTVLTFVLSSSTSLVDLLPPVVYKLFFDLAENTIKTGINANTYQKFTQYSLIYAALAVTEILINRTSMYQWVKWMNKTEAFLNKEAFSHVQNLSLEYFTTNQTGKIVERISKGIGDVLTIMQGVVFQFFPQFVVFLVATIVLFRVNWIFGLIVGIGIPAYVSITLAFNKPLVKIHDDIRKDYESMGAIRTESIYNIRTVKSYVQENSQLGKFMKHMNNKVAHNMNWATTANFMYSLRGIVYYGSFFAGMSMGIFMVIKGNITMGTFILIWSYLGRVYDPMQWIMRLYDDTLRSLRSVKRLYDTLDTQPTVVDVAGAKTLKIVDGEIELKNIEFRYPDNKEKGVISGVSFTIPARKTVAIVGKSGSGKTTLAKLLMRFYDLDGGEIFIDGQDIKKVTQASLRDKISYVLQDSNLFNDTAMNNIRFSSPNAKKSLVISAAKTANADEFISKLPKGYATIVGEKGVKLSGGEQQRINIARAILKNAPILILDEATSSLDSESEMKIQDALNKLIKDKTTIIIAHRLSTIMRADIIVVMDKGKIVQTGTHQDLVNKEGIYSKLFNLQSGAFLLAEDTENSKLEVKV